jgi:hypothetical protein
LNRTLKVNDVSKKLTLDKILKFDLGYWELNHIWTFPNYLDHLWKYVFGMIKKFGQVQHFLWHLLWVSIIGLHLQQH